MFIWRIFHLPPSITLFPNIVERTACPLSLTITKVPQLLPIYQASNEIEGKSNADFVYSLHIGQTLFFLKVQVKIKAKKIKTFNCRL
jgi:hypothetical protein